MKTRMVVVLVDALGWELACREPGFAADLTHRRRLDTILGFSSGALPTLFTGRAPHEHGRWLMYRRATRETPFRGFQWLRFLPPALLRRRRVSAWLSGVVRARGVRGYYHLYEVPRWLLPQFDLAERADVFAPGGLPLESLWDDLARRGIRWKGWNWRTPESQNLAALSRRLDENDESLLFLYTADLDATLHLEGAGGAGVAARLRRYSDWLAGLEQSAASRGERLWIYLMSDHGMVDVTRTVDLQARLRGLPVHWPRDYVPFFDATMARFWWRTPHARAAVREALAGVPGGRWMDDSELERAGALFPDRAYGDDVFLLDPGVMLVPSFMGLSPLKAMHGYEASHPDMAALLWSNRPIPDDVKHIADLRRHFNAELDALEAG